MSDIRSWPRHRRPRLSALVLTLSVLGGCSARDYGRAINDPRNLPTTSEIAERTSFTARNWLRPDGPYMAAVGGRIEELLKRPMSEEAAVEVALLNDAQIQALLQDFGALRAGFVRDLAALVTAGEADGGPTVEWLLIGQTIARPRTVESERGEEGEREVVGIWDPEFAEGYLEVAERVLEKSTATREAYYEAVAAAQISAIIGKVQEASAAAAEIANEQYRSGTLSRLLQAKEQLAHAEAQKALAKARLGALEGREALNRELLLFGSQTDWALPDQLPDLPAERPVVDDPEGLVLREGVAAVAARANARSFEQGAILRSQAREAFAVMLAAYDLAKFQQETVLPASQVMFEEQQLHYNAMLEDVYSLLEAAREQIDAEREQVDSLAGFWKARARFVQLAGGRPPALVASTMIEESKP